MHGKSGRSEFLYMCAAKLGGSVLFCFLKGGAGRAFLIVPSLHGRKKNGALV